MNSDNYTFIEKIKMFNKQNWYLYIIVQAFAICIIAFNNVELTAMAKQEMSEKMDAKKSVLFVDNNGNSFHGTEQLIDLRGKRLKKMIIKMTEKYFVRGYINITHDNNVKYNQIIDFYKKDQLYKEFIDNYLDIRNKLNNPKFAKSNLDSTNRHFGDLLIVLNSLDRKFPQIIVNKNSSIQKWEIDPSGKNIINCTINTLVSVKSLSEDATHWNKKKLSKETNIVFTIGTNKDVDLDVNTLSIRIISYNTEILNIKGK